MDRSLLKAFRASAFLAALGMASCFDELPDPSQGFVEVSAGDVTGVEVLVDGVSQGTALRVGPFDAGLYRVSVRRAGYEIVPAERDVEVQAGRTARAEFTLTLAFTGAARIEAVDEVRGGGVVGAEVLADRGSGSFDPTGVTTPGVVAGLAPGTVRFILRRSGYQDSDPVVADVVVADTTDAITAVLGPPRAVLAEMFTWVVCPNCPPSAAKLKSLREAAPGRVFVLEWHIVNGLPLYNPNAPIRAAYYGSGTIGPATVFQGGFGDDPAVLIGSQVAQLAEYEARTTRHLAECGNDCPVALVVDGEIAAAGVEATVRGLWRGGALPGSLMLRAVLIENDVQAPGNQPYFSFVVRDVRAEAVSWTAAGEVVVRSVSIPVNPAWDADQLELVAFVQSDATREVLAVGGI